MKKKWLSIIQVGAFLIAGITACQPAPGKQDAADAGRNPFTTTPPSRLYFKNIRSTFYEASTQPGTRIDLYRYRRFTTTTERPVLYPVIVDNWMDDEAYLALRPNDFTGGFGDTLRVLWTSGDSSGVFRLASPRWEDQYRLALQIDEGISRKYELKILTDENRPVPIFEIRSDRDCFRTTIRDFLRLTEAR